MKRYEEYKDSGVPWIGEVPLNWGISKIKYSTYVKGRIGWQGLKSDEFIDEGPYLVTGTDLVNGKIVWETCYHINEERYNEAPQIQLRNGDLLITKDGTIGKIAIVTNKPDKAILNSGLFVTRPLLNIYITRFMYWVLNSKVFWSYFGYLETGSTIKHLYQETYENFSFPLPDIQIQQVIADYLDRKTAAIDSLIEDKQKLIELLKEKRRAVISEAVTKGLDKNVKMKDSGIEWIGEIPEDWDIIRSRFIFNITTGNKDTVNSEPEGQYPFYVRSPIIERINTFTFDGEAILMAGDGVGAGKVFHYVNGKFDYHQRVYNFHNFKKVLGRYLFYFFEENFKKEIERGTAKSTVDSIRMGMIQNFPVSFPTDIKEQSEIIDYLDKEATEIDNLVSHITVQIDKLKEYRQAIISEAVTGKVAI